MLYIDAHTAGQIFGSTYINAPRLSKPQDGQENSANGTGPEKTCAGQGGANSTARRCRNAFESPYSTEPGRASISGPNISPRPGIGAGRGAHRS